VILAGTLAALLTVFAFIYWRAVSGPGPGARLPMVPMPAPGSPQATQSGTVQGAAIPVTPYVSTPGDLASQGGATGASGTAAPGGPAVSSSAAGAVAGGGAAGGGAAGGGGTAGSGGPAGAGSATAAGVLAAGGYDTQAVAAPAPPTKPQAEVTIPTPEQLAAIPDPAIRAEAMRDAAERAARQARTEGLPPASSAPAPASTGSVAGMPEISINRTPHEANAPGSPPDTASAAPPRAPAAASKRPASRSSSQSAGTTVAHGGETLKTAVGQNGEVQFVRGAAAAKVAPAVQNGYAALKQGDLATARQQYDLALLQDPNNRDALLGSAAVALRLHDSKQASSSYLRLLELDPNDPDALAGLAELHPGDLQANEIKLKGLARQHPDSGPVQFALGNLFARQGRWAEAQQSYFRAFSAVPDNADYAYNLGVGLDRMNQPRLAQTYYRRALELAQASPPAFNIDTVRKRLQVLETPPQ
jgi:Flp pilus assembly protein TadD